MEEKNKKLETENKKLETENKKLKALLVRELKLKQRTELRLREEKRQTQRLQFEMRKLSARIQQLETTRSVL